MRSAPCRAMLLCLLFLVPACSDQIIAPAEERSEAEFSTVAAVNAPCTGCQHFTGSVNAGGAQTQPSSGWYEVAVAGAHEGWLRGPAGTDFELRLDRWDGSRWRQVAKVNQPGSNEYLAYNGAAGRYRWRIVSRKGSGAYEFWMRHPGMGSPPPGSPPVQSVVVTPGTATISTGSTVQLTARAYDANGNPIPGAVIQWLSAEPTVAAVNSAGLVTGHGFGTIYIFARSGGAEGHFVVTVGPSAPVHSIVVTPGSATLEIGATVQLTAVAYDANGNVVPDAPISWTDGNIWIATVSQRGLVTAVGPGTTSVLAGSGGVTRDVSITVNQGANVTWASVTTSYYHSCGVTADGRGYCWGTNTVGQLGIGIGWGPPRYIPTPMVGGITFAQIDGGMHHSCGVATNGDAYCWGEGTHGQLGNGQVGHNASSAAPQRVLGGHKFRKINVGLLHSCGITTAGAAYCWGNNTYGQLGNGATLVVYGEPIPVRVLGGLTFNEISGGRDWTCGIATDNRLYCWGDNEVGQFGDGASAPGRIVPRPVPGGIGHTWRAIATGDSHACGVTTNSEAYCWGVDNFGELGLGVAGVSRNLPGKVAGNVSFKGIGVGTSHSCAVSTGGTAYCWGFNRYGPLGRGTKNSPDPHPTPEPVIGGVSFAGPIQGGHHHTCAMGTDGRAYCWGSDFNGEAGIQPDDEFCQVPGASAPCHTRPRPVSNPAPSGASVAVAPEAQAGVSSSPSPQLVPRPEPELKPRAGIPSSAAASRPR
jgi:alpha-tubulin suppressor-like RCC1 family protein